MYGLGWDTVWVDVMEMFWTADMAGAPTHYGSFESVTKGRARKEER